MDMQNWLSVIEKNGGWPCVAEFIFDNSCFYYMKPGIPINNQVTYDEDTDTWTFYNEKEPYTINNDHVRTRAVEANEGLQRIWFVEKPEDLARFRRDI